MQVAGIRRIGDPVEMIEVGAPRPSVSSIYVRPDGTRLRELAARFTDGQLAIPTAASYRLADAGQALAQVTGGQAVGAIVLTP